MHTFYWDGLKTVLFYRFFVVFYENALDEDGFLLYN